MPTYYWQPEDDPQKVAAKYNLSLQQLMSANRGSFPASTGATIKIPTGFQTPQTSNYAPYGERSMLPASSPWYAPPKPQAQQPPVPSAGQTPQQFFAAQNPILAATAPWQKTPTQTPSVIGQQFTGAHEPMSTYYSPGELLDMVQMGNVPQNVSPWLANYVNEQVVAQGFQPIYDESGNFVGGGKQGQQQNQNEYTHKIGKDYYKSLGNGQYQARPGTPGNYSGGSIRNWKGTLLNRNKSKRDRGGKSTGPTPQIAYLGLVDLNTGTG